MDQYGTWYIGRPWPRPHCARWGTSPVPKMGHSPQFSADVYCGQTVGWIKMHATWYRGRPRPRPHCATWGPTSRHRKRAQPPIFGPCLLWPNGWMDQDATWCVGRPWPIVLDGTTKKGHCSPPLFGPCRLWPWLHISATAELLLQVIFVNLFTLSVYCLNLF